MISTNFNPSVLTTQRNLNIATNTLNTALERMSTGYKVNCAADDAAGMFVASNLNRNLRGLLQAQKNTQDGISLLNTADGSLSNMTNILNRLRDLAVQGANGVYDESSLGAMQDEAESLTAQLNQIRNGTIFNGLSVFDGSALQNGSTGVIFGDFTNPVIRLSEKEAIAQGYTVIKTAQDLDNIRNNLNGKYILMDDIDLSSFSNWDPIGNDSIHFTGTLEGNGFVIENLTINRSNGSDIGLFGYIDNAEIRNIGLENINIIGHSSVGGLVGTQTSGTISNCYTNGTLQARTGLFCGGLAGYNTGTITDSYSKVSITSGKYDVGGLVGYNKGTITNSFSSGVINGDSSVGGLVGDNTGIVSNCHFTGDVSGFNRVGGLTGKISAGTIENSYSTGTVTGDNEYIGGLVGYCEDSSTIKKSYSSSTVSGYTYVGGLVGWSTQSSKIFNTFATGNVTGNTYVGGLIGCMNRQSSASYSYATGLVKGNSITGGLIGRGLRSSQLTNSIWDREKTNQSRGYYSSDGTGAYTNNYGLTTSQMQDPTNWVGWDDTVWDFSSYPPKLKEEKNSPSLPDVTSSNAIRLQIGEDEKNTSRIYLETYFSLDGFSVDFSTTELCASAIDDIDELLTKINEKRADFGTALNRLSSIADSQVTAVENFAGAKSTIMDADIATESADFVKSQILQQTSSALLAQSQNIHSSIVLSLIQ